MKKPENITCYTSVYDLISDNKPELFEALPEDLLTYFQNIDDFECYAYYLIDSKVFIADDITGNVFDGPDTIESIFNSFLLQYEE